MNIKHIFSTILVLANSTIMIDLASAKTAFDDFQVYSFQQEAMPTMHSSNVMMKQFLKLKSKQKLFTDTNNIVRFVSDKDVNTTFEHDLKTGNLSFQRNFSRYLGGFKPKLPSPEESVEITHRFLEENGFLPKKESELKLAHVGGLRARIINDKNEVGPVIDKLITISYSREINGFPVIGPGSKFVVNVGDKGEIIGLIRHWRELDEKSSISLGSKEFYSKQEAFNLAEEKIASEFGKGAQFEVIQSKIAYYDNNGRFLQPVFAFQTKVILEDKNINPIDYLCVIQAMKKPLEDLQLTALDDKALSLIKNQDDYGTMPEENSKYSD